MQSEGFVAVAQAIEKTRRIEQIEKEYRIPSGLIVPAMSDEAIKYLVLGYLSERIQNLNSRLEKLKRAPGRPAKAQGHDIDTKRALALYDFAHCLVADIQKRERDYSKPAKISARELIKLAQLVSKDGLFPKSTVDEGSLEQSVSRGRKKLGIGRYWIAPELVKNFSEFFSNDTNSNES